MDNKGNIHFDFSIIFEYTYQTPYYASIHQVERPSYPSNVSKPETRRTNTRTDAPHTFRITLGK